MTAEPAHRERWFPELETDPVTYVRLSSEVIDGQQVTKYRLNDQTLATVNNAALAIQNLIRAYPDLFPVFETTAQDVFRMKIQQKPYLTINNLAVSLSKERFEPRAQYRDAFFSQAQIKHPVRCSQGHLLSRNRARRWAGRTGGLCPVLPAHPIGTLEVEAALAHEIAQYRLQEMMRQAQTQDFVNRMGERPFQPIERWFPQLETDPPTYIPLSSERVAGREITKYALYNTEAPTIERAAACVQALLAAHPRLIPAFSFESQEQLRARISRKTFLTINGDAVCLSIERFTIRGEYRDRYFSEGLLKHPVRCSQGHILEAKSARVWSQRRGAICPVFPDHPIGALVVDEDLQREISRYKEGERRGQEQNERFLRQQRIQTLILQIQELRIAHSRRIQKKAAVDAALIPVRVGANLLGIRFLYGVGSGVYRVAQGEWRKAAQEVATGFASLNPLSAPILAYHDMTTAAADQIEHVMLLRELFPSLDLPKAYKILEIDSSVNPNPSQDCVNRAYALQILIVQPDALREFGDMYLAQAGELAVAVHMARQFIYQQRNWTR